MPLEDARRWDARYQEKMRGSFERPRPFLVEQAQWLPRSGLALDVAMGLGGNAGFLLDRGLCVVGVDISAVALRRAKTCRPELMAVLADLTRFRLPPATFDVILNFYFLQRDLWPHYGRALRPGGLLIFETLWHDPQSPAPDFNPAYLLGPGELPRAFAGWEILVYEESRRVGRSGRPRPVASMVARSPAFAD